MATLRVHITAPSVEIAEEVKEAHFKKLYQHNGTKVIFELPEDAREEAQAIVDAAATKDCTGEIEEYSDPIEDAEPVDFW